MRTGSILPVRSEVFAEHSHQPGWAFLGRTPSRKLGRLVHDRTTPIRRYFRSNENSRSVGQDRDLLLISRDRDSVLDNPDFHPVVTMETT